MSENSPEDYEELSVEKGSSNRWKIVQLWIIILAFAFLFMALFFGEWLSSFGPLVWYLGVAMLFAVFASLFKSFHKRQRSTSKKRRR